MWVVAIVGDIPMSVNGAFYRPIAPSPYALPSLRIDGLLVPPLRGPWRVGNFFPWVG